MNFLRLKKMLGVQFIGTLIILIERYGTVPVLTYFWGLETYAVWVLIQIIPSYLAMFDTGLPSAVGNEMVKLIEKKQLQEAKNIFKVTEKTIHIISAFIFVSVLSLFSIFDPRILLNITKIDYTNVMMIITITMFYTFLIFKSQLLYALYRSSQNHVFWTATVYLTRLCEFCSLCLCVAMGADMLRAVICVVSVRFISIVFLTFKAKDKVLIYHIKAECTDFKLIKNLITPSLGFMLLPMVQAINIQGFVWVIAYTTSPSMAAIFNIFRTYSRGVFQVGDIARRSLWAELSIALNNPEMLKKTIPFIKKSLCIVFILSGLVALIGYMISDFMIEKWTLGRVDNDKIVLGYLLAVSVLASVKTVILSVGMSLNKHTSSLFFELVINLIGIILLMNFNAVSLVNVAILLISIETLTLLFFGFKSYYLLKQTTDNIKP